MYNTDKKVNDIGLFIKLSILLLLALLFGFADAVRAQQMQIDDAAITTTHSFQVETWRGDFETIFAPAVGLNQYLELSGALNFDTKTDFELAGWAFETKFVQSDLEETGSAWGLTAGTFFNKNSVLETVYVYVPYSRMILNESSVLHLNAGLAFSDVTNSTQTSITYGVRGDFGVHDRVAILSEIFASDNDFGYQAGFRFGLLPGLLELDFTYGQGFQKGMKYPGFNIGIAFTPDRLW